MNDDALNAIRELAERYHSRIPHRAEVLGVFPINGSDTVAEVVIMPFEMTRRIYNRATARNGIATYGGMFKFYGDVVPMVGIDK